jgi:hypothetical protein
MSIVMQSSSAAAAATLVALNAGSLTFDQACAMIVGQSVGTAATSAMVAIGAGLAVRRAALAHIVYNVAVGIIGILLLGPLAAAGRWVGARVDDPNGVLAWRRWRYFQAGWGLRFTRPSTVFAPHRADLRTGAPDGCQPASTQSLPRPEAVALRPLVGPRTRMIQSTLSQSTYG